MSDVLSQSEIDALLAAMAAGEMIGEETVTADESNTPSTVLEDSLRFSDKDMEVLKYIHTKYSEILSSSIVNRAKAEIALESIEEIRYEEFIRSIPCPTVVTVFKLNPLEGHLLFETSPTLIFQIENLLLDKGKTCELNISTFSEEDKNTFMEITSDFIAALREAWSDVLTIREELEYVETDPAKINLFEKDEHVVLLSFSINVGKINAFFNICIPYSTIEKHSGKLKVTHRSSNGQLSNNLGSTNLNIKVILDTLQLSLDQVMNLKKGKILVTNKKYSNKVSILVEEKHCFNGEVGLLNHRKGVKIIDCLGKDV